MRHEPDRAEGGSLRGGLRPLLGRTAAPMVHRALGGARARAAALGKRRANRRDERDERLSEQNRGLSERNRRLREQRERLREQNSQLKDKLKTATRPGRELSYNADGLAVWGKDVPFLRDPSFIRAYRRGMESGHGFGREKGSDASIHIEWRVHVACWAGWHARHLPGHFVECGVNTGIFSLAVCDHIDFNATGKDFFLFDTFEGIPEEQMAAEEREYLLEGNDERYPECYELARRNFAPFPRARLVRGPVPETLGTVTIDEVCYLSIDMNIAEPERAAIEWFWDRLVPGAPVLLDDYGWSRHALQREQMDEFASSKGVRIATLPTGQGLLLKP